MMILGFVDRYNEMSAGGGIMNLTLDSGYPMYRPIQTLNEYVELLPGMENITATTKKEEPFKQAIRTRSEPKEIAEWDKHRVPGSISTAVLNFIDSL